RLLELDLRQAVAAEDFTLHYQPLVNLRTGRPTGFEALLRWPHAERGLVPPGEFIPVAEEMGLIVPISEWVLRRACQEAASRMGALKVGVNLSAVQFRPGNNLVRLVASALEAAGLPASRLELEITETALLQDTAETIATLHHLKRLGVSISMDDFGTGHSSLSYLLRFPFSKVKIDQSFVRGLGDRGDSAAAIVRAVVGLGVSLNMTVIAEGVETEDQLDQLAAQGLNEAQGYLFSRPLPLDEIPRLLNGPLGPRRARSRAGFAAEAVVAA
ncbi:MAG: putative bifunctional diguanylate cyclase/phosphodiesterase, partial [Geminicoccaceae bacterium]